MINYDPHSWFDHFFDLHGSAIKEILLRVILCVAWSAGVIWFHLHVSKVSIPPTIHGLTGVAIGLLLVFRTNASYDRFWEGRRLWGGMVNSSRNLVRAAETYFGPSDRELLHELARWTAAFPYASMNTLRGVEGLGEIESHLDPDELAVVRKHQHVALAISERMTRTVAKARDHGYISDILQASLDVFIKELIDHLGGCERIRKTPLPFAYVVHLRRALVIYCGTLPFALVDPFGWLTLIDVLLVSYVFFGIEEIGVEIEGPFGFDANDLPLEDICATIRKNVFAIAAVTAADEQAPREPLPEGL